MPPTPVQTPPVTVPMRRLPGDAPVRPPRRRGEPRAGRPDPPRTPGRRPRARSGRWQPSTCSAGCSRPSPTSPPSSRSPPLGPRPPPPLLLTGPPPRRPRKVPMVAKPDPGCLDHVPLGPAVGAGAPDREDWRPVSAVPGWEVSDQGRVRSSRRWPLLILRPARDRKGYLPPELLGRGATDRRHRAPARP